ncbi:bacteriohemerythrin [Fontimonas sp. SYSU GA230001]|uniref:bacteriohemerythrin n=1 Tax=Fontimonas sp. SYSU GA230001 TaxID=3142450 RepID=UPI0032B543CD
MTPVEWTPDFEVGSRAMDLQHQHLVGIVNRYHVAMQHHAPRAELVRTFEEAADYARQHFHDEEALMAEHAYPRFAAHRLLHRQLMDRITELLLKLRAGEAGARREVQVFLNQWLAGHIRDCDVDYKPFVENAA